MNYWYEIIIIAKQVSLCGADGRQQWRFVMYHCRPSWNPKFTRSAQNAFFNKFIHNNVDS